MKYVNQPFHLAKGGIFRWILDRSTMAVLSSVHLLIDHKVLLTKEDDGINSTSFQQMMEIVVWLRFGK